jgi:hypothetical protein
MLIHRQICYLKQLFKQYLVKFMTRGGMPSWLTEHLPTKGAAILVDGALSAVLTESAAHIFLTVGAGVANSTPVIQQYR